MFTLGVFTNIWDVHCTSINCPFLLSFRIHVVQRNFGITITQINKDSDLIISIAYLDTFLRILRTSNKELKKIISLRGTFIREGGIWKIICTWYSKIFKDFVSLVAQKLLLILLINHDCLVHFQKGNSLNIIGNVNMFINIQSQRSLKIPDF